jgi:hypothetical protein
VSGDQLIGSRPLDERGQARAEHRRAPTTEHASAWSSISRSAALMRRSTCSTI